VSRSKGGRRNHHTSFGAKRYRDYLVQIGVCRCSVMPEIQNADPALVVDFQRWLQKHRGAAEPTVRQYSHGATELLLALGDDRTRWNAKAVRAHFLERTARCGVGTAEKLVTSLRAFLRYLSVHGWCRADLDKAVPAFTSWRLADLPKYLTAEQVDRLIAGCDGWSPEGRRSTASYRRYRVGTGTLRVSGKGRCQVRLPLPQDVGDAIIDYIECRPRVCDSDHLFVRNIAPFRSFAHGDGVSSVVKRAMKRAGVVTPAKGAHVLRHTAATEMLRHGVPLDRIALVLRHRGVDTTAYSPTPMSIH
jgi:site-specific recombinase XerD